MRECRIELRVKDSDPLWSILGVLPGRQRNTLARSLLEAALLPGGWAQIMQGQLTVRQEEGTLIPGDRDNTVEPPSFKETEADPTGMSAAATRGFLAGLRKFGADMDD